MKKLNAKTMLQTLLIQDAGNAYGVPQINLAKLAKKIGVVDKETLRRILVGITPADKITLKTYQAIENFYLKNKDGLIDNNT